MGGPQGGPQGCLRPGPLGSGTSTRLPPSPKAPLPSTLLSSSQGECAGAGISQAAGRDARCERWHMLCPTAPPWHRATAGSCPAPPSPEQSSCPATARSTPQALAAHGEGRGGGDAGLVARQGYRLGCGRVPVRAVCPSSWCARSRKICFGVNHFFWSLDSHESLPTSSALAGKALGGGGGPQGPGMGEGPWVWVLLAGEGRGASPGLPSRSSTWGWSQPAASSLC